MTSPKNDKVGAIAPVMYPSLQALIDNSHEAFFGTEAMSEDKGTLLWLKELFDNGTRVLDWLMSKIQTNQEQHHLHLELQLHNIQTNQVTLPMLTHAEDSLCKAVEWLKRETAGAVTPTFLALPALAKMTDANAKAISALTEVTKADAKTIQDLGVHLGIISQDCVYDHETNCR